MADQEEEGLSWPDLIKWVLERFFVRGWFFALVAVLVGAILGYFGFIGLRESSQLSSSFVQSTDSLIKGASDLAKMAQSNQSEMVAQQKRLSDLEIELSKRAREVDEKERLSENLEVLQTSFEWSPIVLVQQGSGIPPERRRYVEAVEEIAKQLPPAKGNWSACSMSEWVRSAYMHWSDSSGAARLKWQAAFEDRSARFLVRFPDRDDLLLFVEANFEDTLSCHLFGSKNVDAERRRLRAIDLYSKIPDRVPSVDQAVAAWNNCGFLCYKWFAYDVSPSGNGHKHSDDGVVDDMISKMYAGNAGRTDLIDSASSYIDKAMSLLAMSEAAVVRSMGPGVLARTLFDSGIKIEGVRTARGNPDAESKLKTYLDGYSRLIKTGSLR